MNQTVSDTFNIEDKYLLEHDTILVVLGPSSAGKSTYIYNNYICKNNIETKIPVLIDYELLDKNVQYELSQGSLSNTLVIIHYNSLCIYQNNKKNYHTNANFRLFETVKILLDNEKIKKRLKIDIINVDRKVLIKRIEKREHVEPLLIPYLTCSKAITENDIDAHPENQENGESGEDREKGENGEKGENREKGEKGENRENRENREKLWSYPRLSILRLLKRVDINYEKNKWIELWKSEGVPFRLIG
jgi:hypothetical protein